MIVATGSSALIPEIEGLREARPWTNIEATTATEAPPRLVVLGGGVVGVELSQAWAAFGSKVTLVHRGERLIEREEPFAGAQVLEALEEGGVDVRLQRSAVRVSRPGPVVIELDDGSTLEADEVLAAFGRAPGTAGIGLETIGLEAGGPLVVGDDLRVPGHDWLFAIGDVNGRALLTHMGKYQGRLAADTILGREVELRSDGASSPRVIFTDPQVGAVGLTLAGGAGGGASRPARRRRDERQRRRLVRRPWRGREPRGSSSTRSGGSSSAPRSRAPRSPRRCMPRRSPSSPRCRSTTSGTPCPRFRRGASCG